MSIDAITGPDVLSDAAVDAAQAATAAGVTVEPVDSMSAAEEVADVVSSIWGADAPKMPAEALRALAFAGSYVVVARQPDGDVVGASIGFWDAPSHGAVHSHITGVRPGHARVGYALKLHQRHWVLAHGGWRITWTFDPLVSRNAYFNLAKLGARVVDYRVNFYGPMLDSFNAGDETDRFVVDWDLTAPVGRSVDIAALRAAGATTAVAVRDDGGPTVLLDVPRGPFLVQVPPDIAELRRIDPPLAREWRTAVRHALSDAIRRGARVMGATRDGWLVVSEG